MTSHPIKHSPPLGERPFYLAAGDEEAVFKAAYAAHLPILLKGPTGCGKTRFLEAMAFDLGRPLVTISCHEDMGAGDLIGRFLLKGAETVWQDGPLTHAVREGGICYLDEVVEMRADALVVLHSLTDYRRTLFIDRLDETIACPPEFALVASYNPGYQSILKALKPSTRQRMVAIEFDFPAAEREMQVVQLETGIDPSTAERLVALARAARKQDTLSLFGPVSTRTLVAAAHLIKAGISPLAATRAAVVRTLTDDADVQRGLEEIAKALFGPDDER